MKNYDRSKSTPNLIPTRGSQDGTSNPNALRPGEDIWVTAKEAEKRQ